MIVDTNIAISVGTFYPLQGQFRIMDCPMNILLREKHDQMVAAIDAVGVDGAILGPAAPFARWRPK